MAKKEQEVSARKEDTPTSKMAIKGRLESKGGREGRSNGKKWARPS